MLTIADDPPDAEAEEQKKLKDKEKLFARLFPDLCPPQYVKDIFMKVECSTLENMVQYAKHRAQAAFKKHSILAHDTILACSDSPRCVFLCRCARLECRL